MMAMPPAPSPAPAPTMGRGWLFVVGGLVLCALALVAYLALGGTSR
jgi:hypothetical protein